MVLAFTGGATDHAASRSSHRRDGGRRCRQRRPAGRAHGAITQGRLDGLRDGIEVEGVKYGPIEATLDTEQGANVWITFAIREGKNREIRKIFEHFGCRVSRLLRLSYGPFQLGGLPKGEIKEVPGKVLKSFVGN